jgi:L-alanine-DL-glutamate epimerase-like enolase superfamily enzyme
LQPYAGIEGDLICEYPVEPKQLALDITREHLLPDTDGLLRLPERPGLGMTPNTDALTKYLVDVEMRVGGAVVYRTPQF